MEDEPGSAPSDEDVEIEAILRGPQAGRQPQAAGPAASGASEDQVLLELRRGRWALGLEGAAREGLTRPGSFGKIAHEMSKWLWWVELHDLPEPERQETIVRLLGAWARRKHNGCVSRIEAGDLAAVDRQVVTAVTQARKPEGKNLSLFALYRQERSLGRYKHVVHIAPLLEADGTIPAAVPSQSRLHEVCDDPLPEAIEAALSGVVVRKKMRRRDGEYPFVRFARRFLNCLGGHGGSCRVNRESMYAFLGYADPNQQLAYKKLLVRADLLRRGWEDTIRRWSQSARIRPHVGGVVGVP